MRALLACAAAGLVALPALAQSPPMDTAISEKSPSIEVLVEVDRRLQADARLHASILNEAKRIATLRRREADEERRKDGGRFRVGPWSFERGYYLDAAAGPYLSVSVLEYSYAGGAHPNHRIATMLWDREQGRRASIEELFRETKPGGPTLSRLAVLIRAEIAKEKRERGIEVETPIEQDEWLSVIKADLNTMGAPALVASTVPGKAAGIDFHFSPYDVGPYVEGAFGAFIPWRAIEPLLTEKALRIFGGEPADDAGGTEAAGGSR